MKGFKSFNIVQRELANFCYGLKGNLEEQYVRFWKDQIQQQENQGKLRTFKKFKTNLNYEEYLGDISNIKHRQAVTKLRISSHRLPVESGRYNNIPFDKRTCKLCNAVTHCLKRLDIVLSRSYTKLIAHFHYLMIKTCFYISYQ